MAISLNSLLLILFFFLIRKKFCIKLLQHTYDAIGVLILFGQLLNKLGISLEQTHQVVGGAVEGKFAR